MNSKVIIIGTIISLILLVGGLFWLSRPEVKPEVLTANAGRLATSETAYDFGSISMAKGLVTHKFSITNSDSVAATITKLYSSCMCTKAKLYVSGKEWGPFGMPGMAAIPSIAAVIAPGESAEIEAIFDPAAHGPAGVGKIDRMVTAELNGQSSLKFNFSALVTP